LISPLTSPLSPITARPLSSSISQEDNSKKLEIEVKRLKEQLTEIETKRINQKKQYQTKISNLSKANEQLLAVTKQLSLVVENTTTKQTTDQFREKELLSQIQQIKNDLFNKQEEVLRCEESNKMLLKTMEMFKVRYEEKEIGSYRQTNQLLWGQIVLWIFIVIVFVLVFSLFIKTTETKADL